MFGEGALEFFLIVDLGFRSLGFLLQFPSAFVFLWAQGGNLWVVYCVAALESGQFDQVFGQI